MADTEEEEVAVSVGDVVVVKSEDESSDPNKTQVILQLQPITTGYVAGPLQVSAKQVYTWLCSTCCT